MATLQSTPLQELLGKRVSRVAGKMWLVVMFAFLLGMTFAVAQIVPLIGSLSSQCMGVLVISVVWEGVLFSAIWCKQGWARYVLAAFLFCFVIVQVLFVAGVGGSRYVLQEEEVQVVVLDAISNIFAAVFLLTSADIRQLSHRSIGN